MTQRKVIMINYTNHFTELKAVCIHCGFVNFEASMAKNRLLLEDYFDFHLIGLVSTVKEYKLSWHVNRLLNLELEKKDDLQIEFSKNARILISNFAYKTEHTEVVLLKNRLVGRSNSAYQYLLDELRQFDYLLKFKDESNQTNLSNLLSLIKSMGVIDYAANLEPTLIKSRDNLIF